MRSVWIAVLVLLALAFSAHGPVQACSGGSPPGAFPVDYLLSSYDTIVAGGVRSLSESRINAVLGVEYHLRGAGDDALLVLANEPAAYIALVADGRPYPTRCSYLDAPVESDRPFVGGVRRHDDGTYSGILLSANAEDIFSIRELDRPDETLTFSYEEMIDYIAQQVGAPPHIPQRRVLPRAASLRLTTQAGNIYVLPVDQNSLARIDTNAYTELICSWQIGETCTNRIIAPSGVDAAFFYPIGSGVESLVVQDMNYYPSFEAYTGVFSHDSDLIAVWGSSEVRVFATASQMALGISAAVGPTLLRTFVADMNDPLITGAGAWSPNGRTFAFSTASGVWTWDALSPEAEPVRLLTAADLPIRVRHFSPAGNYLALETDERRYHVDLLSLQEYPDGLFSPDDRLLVAYDTAVEGSTPLSMYTVLPQLTLLWGGSDFYSRVSQFEWVDRVGYLYAACGDPIYEPEFMPDFDHPWCKVYTDQFGYIDGTSFDYDPVTRSLAVLDEGNIVTVNGETFDFSEQVDEAIIRVELESLIDLDYRRF